MENFEKCVKTKLMMDYSLEVFGKITKTNMVDCVVNSYEDSEMKNLFN